MSTKTTTRHALRTKDIEKLYPHLTSRRLRVTGYANPISHLEPTMADIKPKFKFKKPKSSPKKKQLRRDSDDAQDADASEASVQQDEEEPSAIDKIRDLERRRKLFSKNRGVDAANLGKATLLGKANSDEEDVDAPAAVKNKDLEERLKGTFDKGKLAGSNDMGGDDEGGILAKKHKKAMEEYIKSNLQEQQPDVSNGASDTNGEGEFKTSADLEKEMYSDLLVGEARGGISPKKEEEDVGAGGAMMGGTGIAEVTLPIDERIKAMKDTERAAMEYEKAKKARLGIVNDDDNGAGAPAATDTSQSSVDMEALATMVPMNFASGPGKRKRKDIPIAAGPTLSAPQQPINTYDPSKSFAYPIYSSAIPAGSNIEKDNDTNLSSSYSHNFAQHNREWIEQKKDERQAEIDALAAQNAEDGPEESKARVGFDAARRLARGEVIDVSANGGDMKNEWDKKGSNDDRVWKTFMSNERNKR